MNDFHLIAHGETFDVDAFLATTTLRPGSLWRRGDQRRSACFESRHPTSGIEFDLGDGLSVPLSEQEGIAIAYLQEHRDELRALGQFPGVRVFILSLRYTLELDPCTVGFWVDPSARLMRHCLDIGVHLTYHVRLDRRREWESEDAEPGAAADRPRD
jgi:hypothetical protein